MDCSSNPFDPWCFCFNNAGDSLPFYKQYNANNSSSSRGIGNYCCHNIYHDPSFLAQQLPTQGAIDTNREYLEKIQTTVQNDVCDYNVYLNQVAGDSNFNQKFPDLYRSTNAQRILFNAFFNKDNSVHNGLITTNVDLIPTFTDNNVSCPVGNYIPYYLAYNDEEFGRDKYMYICYPRNTSFPNLNLEYRTLYFYNNNNNNCKNNSCSTTTTSAHIGYNAGEVAHTNNNGKKISNNEIIIISVVSVLAFISLIIIIYYFLEKRKKKSDTKLTNSSSKNATKYIE